MANDINLTFGTVERALMRLHGIEGEKRRMTLRSRLQHLQRAGFPAGVRVGKGPKVAYGTDQFFQLVFVLALAEARIPPLHAARIIGGNWAALRRFVDDGVSRYAAGLVAGARPSDRWCLIELQGLANLREDGGEETAETVQEVASDVVAGWMLGASPPPAAPWLMIDLADVVLTALAIVREPGVVTPDPA